MGELSLTEQVTGQARSDEGSPPVNYTLPFMKARCSPRLNLSHHPVITVFLGSRAYLPNRGEPYDLLQGQGVLFEQRSAQRGCKTFA